jgi:hypothetical protein
MNTALEYSTRVVQEGDRRCKKSTLNDLAYLTPLKIPLMNPVIVSKCSDKKVSKMHLGINVTIVNIVDTLADRNEKLVLKTLDIREGLTDCPRHLAH